MVVGWEKQLAKWCEQLKGSKYSRKFVMGSKAGKGRRDWSWQDARWEKPTWVSSESAEQTEDVCP